MLYMGICLSAQNNFKDTLSQDDIAGFKEELTFKYRLFFESVLNIIDNDSNIFSRRNARYLIISLFENERANVTDYLDNKYPETLTIHDYATRLFHLEQTLPLLDKRYKFSDSISVNPSIKNINQKKYSHLSEEEKADKFYQIYEGELFFLEEIISVQKVRKDVYDAVDRSVVKKIKFSLSHDENDHYKLFINSISILDPRNRRYDYVGIKKEIQTSTSPWSDAADPVYLEDIKQEALQRGIVLVKDNAQPAEEEFNKQNWYYDAPKAYDYLVPGLGHLRFGSDKQRYTHSIAYGTSFLGSAALAVYFKNRAIRYKELSLQETAFAKAEEYQSLSEKQNKRFLLAGGVALGTYIGHIIHLSVKDSKQKNLIGKVISQSQIKLDIGPDFALQQHISFKVQF